MALFYKYYFMLPDGTAEVIFYDESEAGARKQYMALYEVAAKALVKRENW